MPLIEQLRSIIKGPASDRWPMPERLRRSLRSGFRLIGFLTIASVVSFAIVLAVPLSLESKAVLFSALGFTIYALLVVFAGATTHRQ